MFDSVSHSLPDSACEDPCGARPRALFPHRLLLRSIVSFFLKMAILSPRWILSCVTPLPPLPAVTVICQPLHGDRVCT